MAHGKKRLAVPASILILLLSLVLFLRVDALTVRLPREENRLFGALRVVSESEIRLSYRHSVEKTMVEGVFSIGPGPVLKTKETRMTSVGTGLPNAYAARTRQEGQWLIVDEKMSPIAGFDFFISEINAPRLAVDGTDIGIERLASGSVIHIDVERMRLLGWILWRCGHMDWRKDQQ